MFRSTVCRLKNKNPDITQSFSDTGILFPHYVFSEKTLEFLFRRVFTFSVQKYTHFLRKPNFSLKKCSSGSVSCRNCAIY